MGNLTVVHKPVSRGGRLPGRYFSERTVPKWYAIVRSLRNQR